MLAGTATAQDEVPQGGTIVVGEWQAATQLNTFMSNALRDQEAAWIISRPLVIVDDQGNYIPEFLTELPTVENGGLVEDEDGEGYTMHITMKDGQMWSDGTPFTLHDFKALYEWSLEINRDGTVACVYCLSFVPIIDADPALPLEERYAPENLFVESITVSEDGLTADVKFQQNFSGYISGLLFQPLIAPHYWSEVPLEEIATRAVPGSDTLLEIPTNGPFIVTAASSEGIDYAPNPHWTADNGPNLEQLRLRFFGQKDGMFTAFLDGTIDLTLNTTPADVPTLQSVDPSIGSVLIKEGWLYEHLDFNTEREELGLSDPAVRSALRQAIDVQGMLDVLFPGAGLTPACSIAPANLWYHAALECAPYDPEAAAAALDELGWVEDPELGTRAKDGVPMRFHMCTSSGNPLRLTTLGRVSQDLAAIGVATDIETADISVYFGTWDQTTAESECNIYRGTFDIALYTSQVTGDPYFDWFTNYHSSQPATEEFPGGVAVTRIADPELDELLVGLGSTIDPEVIGDRAIQVQERIHELANEIPLYYRFEPLGVSNRLGGFKTNPSTATALWDVENWYVQG
jgi:peptide/nickel transport system substrate-binding protein